MIKVKGKDLRPGDTFPDGTIITEVWKDPEGVWINCHDGDCGYVSENGTYRVERN